MPTNINSFSICKQNSSWAAFRWLLLMITFAILSGCQVNGSIGGLTIPEAYREGLKKEEAKDYKGAIAYYDEAIDNFARLPGWLAKASIRGALDPKQLTDVKLVNLEQVWMPHRVYFHRAQSKKALGDIAGEKGDLALFEKQRALDEKMAGEVTDEDAAKKAEAAKDAADAKASAENNAMKCVQKFIGFRNACDRSIRIEVIAKHRSDGKNFCTGAGYHDLGPNQEFSVSVDCGSFMDVTSATYLDH